MNLNQLHEQFVEYGQNAKKWLRKCTMLLPEIERQQVWKQKGFESIHAYAAKLACMSHGQVDDALRILKRIAAMPSLLKVAEEKGLNAVRPVATIATEKTAGYWAKNASRMSRHELEAFVRDHPDSNRSSDSGQDPDAVSGSQPALSGFEHSAANLQPPLLGCNSCTTGPASDHPQSKTIIMQLKPELATKLENLNKGNWNELMEKFIKLYEKDLEESKPPVKEKASRPTPSKTKAYVLKRSGGYCEFPKCRQKYKHLHHTNRYYSNKTHNPDQIIALCKAHHDLAHRSLIDNEESPPANWKIRSEPNFNTLNWLVDREVQRYRLVQ